MERLNIGTIIGLPIGIAVYFWANRLLAIDFSGRAEMEVLALFTSWGLCFIYPVLRPVKRAWVELCWVAAALYGLLPFLNGLTCERHLGVSFVQQDWVMAGVDITMLLLGVMFALMAMRLQNQSVRGWLRSLVRACSTLWGTKRHDYS